MRAAGPPLPQHRWKAGYERESGRRRDLVFATAAAAVCSVVAVAAAVEPKRRTSDAKKIYAPVRVTMPTAQICHKWGSDPPIVQIKDDLYVVYYDLALESSHSLPCFCFSSVSQEPDLGFALSNPATSMDCASSAPCLRSVNPGLGFLTNRRWAGVEGYIAI
ncbi:hypothetical protein U1Q18_004167 [Sarracenia purpurea var. burkii]